MNPQKSANCRCGLIKSSSLSSLELLLNSKCSLELSQCYFSAEMILLLLLKNVFGADERRGVSGSGQPLADPLFKCQHRQQKHPLATGVNGLVKSRSKTLSLYLLPLRLGGTILFNPAVALHLDIYSITEAVNMGGRRVEKYCKKHRNESQPVRFPTQTF